LSSGRLAALGATLDFRHGLLRGAMDSRDVINSIFGSPRALIGVIHVQALPGTPSSRNSVAAQNTPSRKHASMPAPDFTES